MRFRLLLALSLPAPLAAQSGSSAPPVNRFGHATAVPSAIAAPRNGPVVLDGKLDEAAWSAATPITNFTQVDPDEGKPASQRTEVRFLFDDDALYVGAKMYDTDGAKAVMT